MPRREQIKKNKQHKRKDEPEQETYRADKRKIDKLREHILSELDELDEIIRNGD